VKAVHQNKDNFELGLYIKSLILQPLYWYTENHRSVSALVPGRAQMKQERKICSMLQDILIAGKLENLETFVWEGMTVPSDDRIWETLRLRLDSSAL
jgi:hypothetical protein